METYDRLREGEKGAWVSIVAYIILSAIKIAIGLWTASKALTADGVNNTTDIIVSVAVLVGLRIARKPPDTDHPYGHMRAETIASMVASFIMFAAGLQVIMQAGQTFWSGESASAPGMLAAWTALGGGAVMWAVYRYNRKLAERISNQSLMAAALDNRSDALVGFGAAAGIIGSRLGFPWLDPLAAVLVGVVICKTAWDIFAESSHALTDGFDEKKLKEFRRTVKETPGVKRLKDIKARVHGSNVLLDVVVEVSAELSVEQSHDISDEIENRMRAMHRIDNVHVHIEPYSEPQPIIPQGNGQS